MRKALLLLVAMAMLWVPAVSVAGDSSTSSSKTETLRATTAASNPAKKCQGTTPFGTCVSTSAKHKSETHGHELGKSHDKTESQSEADSESEDDSASRDKSSINPAKTCKAMRANDLAHFQSAYGTRPNAFGKCVSRHPNGKNS